MPRSSGGRDRAHQNAAWADSEKIESSQLFDNVRLVMRQMWWRDGFTGGGWSLMTTPAFPTMDRHAPCGVVLGSSGVGRLDHDHGGQLDQLCLVLIGVMLAKKQLGSRRQRRADASGCAATVTAISPS
jgi:hypothetical protein